MNNPKKIRVGVVYGGRSPEHEVSVMSAANVMEYLDRSRFEVIPIKIDKQGTWFLEGNRKQLPEFSTPLVDSVIDRSPALPQKLFTPDWLKEPEAVMRASLSEHLFDVIFPVMHGTFSEDGTIQGLLELADVPYVGCGVLASAIGMDKDIARRLVSYAGVPTVSYLAVKHDQWNRDAACIEAQVAKMFTWPVFVKPANQGSSIGVSKVKTSAELFDAVEEAFCYDTKILIEQGIFAAELEVAVLESLEEGLPPFASVVGEIRPHAEFYSYTAKYTDGGADLIIPAATTDDMQQSLRTMAVKIFSALGAEGMARIDFFVDKNTQKIFFNEMNSIPGFTLLSMYPRMMTASGITYPELLTHLVMLAVKKQEQKQKLKRSYTHYAISESVQEQG